MRFQLIGKTPAKFCNVQNQSKKMGQKNLLPGVKIRVMASVPNNVLEMFDPALRTFLYERPPGSVKIQKQLDGIEVVTDLPQLRQAGVRLGTLHWKDEMTGATLSVDHGIGGPSNIKLRDCTVDDFKLVPKDGGTTQVFFSLFSTDVDRDTVGDLGMLHQHEVLIELTAPDIVNTQRSFDDNEDDDGPLPSGTSTAADPAKPSNPFPMDADPVNPAKAWPFPNTPEAALAASVSSDTSNVKVVTRRSRLKTTAAE